MGFFLFVFFLGLPLNFTNFKLEASQVLGVYFWLTTLCLGSFIGAWGLKKSGQESLLPFSLPLSFLFLSWMSWIIMHVFSVYALPFFVLILGILSLRKLESKTIVRVMTYNSVFILVVWIFTFLNSFHPEVFWGEKAMDFNLLNFLARNEQFPPQDPWMWGKPLKYYYFGYFMFGKFGNSVGLTGEVSYHMALASSAGFFFLSGLSLMKSLGHRFIPSVGGALALIAATSIGGWLGYIIEGKKGANAFWAATRVFKNQGFAEYPFWSFVFGDLHPHVMSYAFALFAMVLLLRVALGEKRKVFSLSTFILGFSVSSLVAISTWDLIFVSFLFVMVFLATGKEILKEISIPVAALMGGVCWSPIFLSLVGGKGASLGFFKGEHNTILNYFQHQGLWWLLILSFLVLHKVEKREVRKISKVLFGSFLVLMIFTEYFVFIDRINTVFKFGNLLFILLGVISLLLYRNEKRFNLISLLFLTIFIGSSFFDQLNVSKYNAFGTIRPTLKATAFLKRVGPAEKDITDYINKNISGTPLIIEAWGKSFDNNRARISSHTGLPSYLGWEGHVITRGADARETLRRKKEIDALYNSPDALKSFEWLKKRGIEYIVVSSAEYGKYERKGIDKFKQYIDLFVPVVQTIKYGKTIGLYKVGK